MPAGGKVPRFWWHCELVPDRRLQWGSRGRQRSHVTTRRTTRATRTSDVCVLSTALGAKGGGYSQGGSFAASTRGSTLPRPPSSARLRSCLWMVAFQATSCYAQVAIPMGSMMIRVRLTQA